MFERWRQRLMWDGTSGRPRSSQRRLVVPPDVGGRRRPRRAAVDRGRGRARGPGRPRRCRRCPSGPCRRRSTTGVAPAGPATWACSGTRTIRARPRSTGVATTPVGGELAGSAAALPSALDNPNTRDLAWSDGVALPAAPSAGSSARTPTRARAARQPGGGGHGSGIGRHDRGARPVGGGIGAGRRRWSGPRCSPAATTRPPACAGAGCAWWTTPVGRRTCVGCG